MSIPGYAKPTLSASMRARQNFQFGSLSPVSPRLAPAPPRSTGAGFQRDGDGGRKEPLMRSVSPSSRQGDNVLPTEPKMVANPSLSPRGEEKQTQSQALGDTEEEVAKLFSLRALPSRAQLFLDVRPAPESLMQRVASLGVSATGGALGGDGDTRYEGSDSIPGLPWLGMFPSATGKLQRIVDCMFFRSGSGRKDIVNRNPEHRKLMRYVSEHTSPFEAWSSYFSLVARHSGTFVFKRSAASYLLDNVMAVSESPLSFSTVVLNDLLNRLWGSGWDDVTAFEDADSQGVSVADDETPASATKSSLAIRVLSKIFANRRNDAGQIEDSAQYNRDLDNTLLIHWPSAELVLFQFYNLVQQGRDSPSRLLEEKIGNLLGDQTALSVNDFLFPLGDVQRWCLQRARDLGVLKSETGGDNNSKQAAVGLALAPAASLHWRAMLNRLLAERDRCKLIEIDDMSQFSTVKGTPKIRALLLTLDSWSDPTRAETSVKMSQAILSETVLVERLKSQVRICRHELAKCEGMAKSYMSKGSRHLAQAQLKKQKLMERQIQDAEEHTARLLEMQSSRNRSMALRVVAGVVESLVKEGDRKTDGQTHRDIDDAQRTAIEEANDLCFEMSQSFASPFGGPGVEVVENAHLESELRRIKDESSVRFGSRKGVR